jgi:hypothetical protein
MEKLFKFPGNRWLTREQWLNGEYITNPNPTEGSAIMSAKKVAGQEAVKNTRKMAPAAPASTPNSPAPKAGRKMAQSTPAAKPAPKVSTKVAAEGAAGEKAVQKGRQLTRTRMMKEVLAENKFTDAQIYAKVSAKFGQFNKNEVAINRFDMNHGIGGKDIMAAKGPKFVVLKIEEKQTKAEKAVAAPKAPVKTAKGKK